MSVVWSSDEHLLQEESALWLRRLFVSSLHVLSGASLVGEILPDHPAQKAYQEGRLVVMAVGKAAVSMADGVIQVMPASTGIGVSPEGTGMGPRGWEWMEASHPLPDHRSLQAASRLLALATSLAEGDRLLCLLSGGASSLLAAPIDGITLEDLAGFHHALLRSGADIHEMNTLRRALSNIKGGGLLRALAPAKGWTLAISDVSGDHPLSIGSGPTVATNPSTDREAACEIIRRYDLHDEHPMITSALLRPKASRVPMPSQEAMPFCVIGNNAKWLQLLAQRGREADCDVILEEGGLDQEMELVIEALLTKLRQPMGHQPRLLLFGGEPHLRVVGVGRGGRMQHLGLWLALLFAGASGIHVLAGASDGADGATDVAAVIVDGEALAADTGSGTWKEALRSWQQFDSYHFYKENQSIKLGPTGTNLCDLLMVLQWPDASLPASFPALS